MKTTDNFWQELLNAIIDNLTSEIPQIESCGIYPIAATPLIAPAVLLEIAGFEPGTDPGTEETAIKIRFEARVIVDSTIPDAVLTVYALASEVIRVVDKNTWGIKISPAKFLHAGPDSFKPELDAYLVWSVEWVQETHRGESVWAPTNVKPHTIYIYPSLEVDIARERAERKEFIVINDNRGKQMSFNFSELDRRLHNLIRLGTIKGADYKNAKVRVEIGELVTDWLPWLTAIAGNDRNWSAPSIGEQVVVLSPSGEMAQGVVLSALYQQKYPPPTDNEKEHIVIFEDGAEVKYNKENNLLKFKIPKKGKIFLKVGSGLIGVSDSNITAKIASSSIELNGTEIKAEIGSSTLTLTGESIKMNTGSLTFEINKDSVTVNGIDLTREY